MLLLTTKIFLTVLLLMVVIWFILRFLENELPEWCYTVLVWVTVTETITGVILTFIYIWTI